MWTSSRKNSLEQHVNGSGGPNFENGSSSLNSYATFNDSGPNLIYGSKDSQSSTELSLSQTGLNCPICQHDFCFSSLLCATGHGQNGLAQNCMKVVRDLHSRLHGVSLECTVLRSELEVLHKAFNSKCQAVKILTINNSQPLNENEQARSNIYASTVELEKEINRLKIDLELSKGALLSQHQSSKAKIQQLKNENENLKRQLENLHLKTGQLLEENMHLLQKNIMLICPPTHEDRVEEPFTVINSDKSTKFYLDKNSLEKLADQDVPVTSEGMLYSLENRIRPHFQDKQIPLPEMKTNPKDASLSQNGFQLFFNRFRSSKLDKLSDIQQQQQLFQKPSVEKDSQCDIGSFFIHSSSIREISIPLKCSCVNDTIEACECARTAINIQRQLLHYKCQLSEMTKKIKQLELSEDAYRHALKEQYERNKIMSIQLAGILPHTPDQVLNSPNHNLPDCPSSMANPLVKSSSIKTNPPVSQTTLSSTESLHNLLLWFHKTLKATSVSLKSLSSLSSPYIQLTLDQDKSDSTTLENVYPKPKSPTAKAKMFTGSSKPEYFILFNESNRYQYEKMTPTEGNNKQRDGSNKEQISLATKRKISLKGIKSTCNSMQWQTDDLSLLTDKIPGSHNYTSQKNNEPFEQNQIVYQRKISRSSSIHAKQLKSRCRSMEQVSQSNFSEDENMNTMLLHQLLLQMNNIAELIAKQNLISDKRVRRSSLVLT
ncbi:sp8 [Schistosoma japonicum]|nr:sp8 [Schistosoma japonicum]